MTADDKGNALLNALRSYGAQGSNNEVPPPPPPVKYPVLNGLWYNRKVIKLDGWIFDACRFDNCMLVIETPYFTVKNCYIDSSNTVEVQGVLMNAVKFLNMTTHMAAHPAYQPFRNVDGTVSIGA